MKEPYRVSIRYGGSKNFAVLFRRALHILDLDRNQFKVECSGAFSGKLDCPAIDFVVENVDAPCTWCNLFEQPENNGRIWHQGKRDRIISARVALVKHRADYNFHVGCYGLRNPASVLAEGQDRARARFAQLY